MRLLPKLILGLLSAIALAVASVSIGPAGLINPLILASEASETFKAIAEYRLVRTLSLLMLGASLGAAGAAMQQGLRNYLVDPYLVGLSSGAALGVVVAMVAGYADPAIIHLAALAGGLTAFTAVLASSYLAGLRGASFIVIGVAYSYLLSSISIILILISPERLPAAFIWLLGTAAYVEKPLLTTAAPLSLAGLLALIISSKNLEVLSLGEEYSEGLGLNVRALRAFTVTASTLSVAPLVALIGPVGFLGLTSPWIARMLGASRFQEVLVLSVIYGVSLAILADLVARTLLSPRELPLTVVTSVAGAPLLVYLSTRRRGISE